MVRSGPIGVVPDRSRPPPGTDQAHTTMAAALPHREPTTRRCDGPGDPSYTNGPGDPSYGNVSTGQETRLRRRGWETLCSTGVPAGAAASRGGGIT